MSVRLMGEVWGLDLAQGEQSVMLALADHAEDDGTRCYPSVEYIAWKTGYSERQVQRLLHRLQDTGLIQPVAYERGGRGHATEYRIDITKGDKKSPFKGRKGDMVSPFTPNSHPQRVTSATVKGDICDTKGDICDVKGDIAMSPQPFNHHEPSVEPSDIAHTRTRPTSKPKTVEPDKHPLSESWWPPPEKIAEAEAKHPGVDIPAETHRFVLNFTDPDKAIARSDAGHMQAWWRWLASPYPKVMRHQRNGIAIPNGRASPSTPEQRTRERLERLIPTRGEP